jgi:hypothetical protein
LACIIYFKYCPSHNRQFKQFIPLARVCDARGFALAVITPCRKKQYNYEDKSARVADARETGNKPQALRVKLSLREKNPQRGEGRFVKELFKITISGG